MKKKLSNISPYRFFVLLFLSVAIACNNANQHPPLAAAVHGVYTCPMHHQIEEDKPGSCPICGMTLVKKNGQISEKTNISLSDVLQPVNANVIAGIETVMPRIDAVPVQITAQGYLDFDTRTFNNISARFSGRIEKLYIKSAFEEIHRGQRIFDIYSPDMVTAEHDFLYLIKNSATETELITSAKQRLLLMGMTTTQIKQLLTAGKLFYSLPVYSDYDGHVHDVAHSQMPSADNQQPKQNYTSNNPLLIREGMYVEKGQTVFNVVDPHHLWALVKINLSDIASVKLDQPVEIQIPDMPGMVMDGKVGFIEPIMRDGDKTVTVRVYMHNMDHHLKVNGQVNAIIKTGIVKGLWIPSSAIIDLGNVRMVWLKTARLFKATAIQTGVANAGKVLVTGGLSATDTIALNAQYLTDSESFIKVNRHEKQ